MEGGSLIILIKILFSSRSCTSAKKNAILSPSSSLFLKSLSQMVYTSILPTWFQARIYFHVPSVINLLFCFLRPAWNVKQKTISCTELHLPRKDLNLSFLLKKRRMIMIGNPLSSVQSSIFETHPYMSIYLV